MTDWPLLITCTYWRFSHSITLVYFQNNAILIATVNIKARYLRHVGYKMTCRGGSFITYAVRNQFTGSDRRFNVSEKFSDPGKPRRKVAFN
jgi:hypothetical protein